MCPIAESGHIYKASLMSTSSVKIESNGAEASKLVVDDLMLLHVCGASSPQFHGLQSITMIIECVLNFDQPSREGE